MDRDSCIREIGDIIRRQPPAVKEPLLQICQKMIEYADIKMGFGVALQLREILQIPTDVARPSVIEIKERM